MAQPIVQKNFRLPYDLAVQLEEYSAESGKTQQETVIEALERYLDNKEQPIKNIRRKKKMRKEEMKKIRIYWSEEDLQLDHWDVPDVMKSVVAEIEEQGIEIGLWDDGENIGISWSLEVSDIPETLSREFEIID
jgi:predicted DNA-binding protein